VAAGLLSTASWLRVLRHLEGVSIGRLSFKTAWLQGVAAGSKSVPGAGLNKGALGQVARCASALLGQSTQHQSAGVAWLVATPVQGLQLAEAAGLPAGGLISPIKGAAAGAAERLP